MAVVFLIITLMILVLLLHKFLNKKYSYWKKRKVPYPKPVPFFGNYAEYIIMRKFSAEILDELCKQFPNEPYFGTYFGTEPALVIKDPEIIKLVFTKDFYYFHSRDLMDHIHNELITQNLFFDCGDSWKIMRQNLTPLFSTAKLKNIFYLIDICAHKFEKLIDREASISEIIDARELMVRYTMDCIISCSFGVDAHIMASDSDPENNPFTIMGRAIFGVSYYRGFKTITRAMWPKLFYGVGLKLFPPKLNTFFRDLLLNVFESRNYEPSTRNDFVDFLLNFKKGDYLEGDKMSNLKTGKNEKVKLEITEDLLVSNCVEFFGAGFETSASALGLTLYELAKNQKAQTRALAEIDEYLYRHNNKVEFECIKELPFVEACVSETQRLYPALGIITRETVEDYRFPSGLIIEKGTRIHLPAYHIQRHPDNFADPEKYKPERFLQGAQQEIKPYTFFPFGEGPRHCPGYRFAKMQMFPGLITLLKKYRVELAPDTPERLSLASTSIVLEPAEQIKLKLTLRDGWEQRVYAN